MPGILMPPQAARTSRSKARLAELKQPVADFLATVPEAKAYIFAVQSMDPALDAARLGQTWGRAIPAKPNALKGLEYQDRYPAAAWRLEHHPAADRVANILLADMPNGHNRASCLLAIAGLFYWVPDSGILDLHASALGSYPKLPIQPIFSDEPTGHDRIEAEAEFVRLFPDVDETVTRTWGSGIAHHA